MRPMQSLSPRRLTTPPPSPCKRRHILRDSDNCEEEMTIEQLLYRMDPFRKSSSTNPLPLPIHMTLLQGDYPVMECTLGPRILDILTENLLLPDRVYFGSYSCSKPGYPGGETPFSTLVVCVDQGDDIANTWGKARSSLSEFLALNGLPKIQVDVWRIRIVKSGDEI